MSALGRRRQLAKLTKAELIELALRIEATAAHAVSVRAGGAGFDCWCGFYTTDPAEGAEHMAGTRP